MEEVLFCKCSEINNYLIEGNEIKARELLIQLLDFINSNNIPYSPLINYLIREVGLYPYMDVDSSNWNDAFEAVSCAIFVLISSVNVSSSLGFSS